MRLVERHIIKDNRFEDVCLKSGLLYNYVLFNVRQGIFSGDYINEYEFSTKLCKENQVDFRNLPSVVSQQVVAQVFSVTKSWMKSKKEYEKNPSKFLSRPKLPKYKKGKKQNMVVFIVNICIENNIGNLVVGLNKGWKNGVNLGKRINQKFVEIPFSKLVEKISYKCKLVGIDFQVHEESYTSKVDHLAFEKLGKHDVYLGKRKKRGLFQSSIGKLLNADINGAIGIGRKVFGDSYVSKIIGSGLAFNPVRVNIL